MGELRIQIPPHAVEVMSTPGGGRVAIVVLAERLDRHEFERIWDALSGERWRRADAEADASPIAEARS